MYSCILCSYSYTWIIQSTYRAVYDDVIKWKHFPRYWLFVRGIHRSPVNNHHKGQWCGALMFSLIAVWVNGCVSNRDAGDLRRHHAHYDVIVMLHTVRALSSFVVVRYLPIWNWWYTFGTVYGKTKIPIFILRHGTIRHWYGILQIMEVKWSRRLMPRKSGHLWLDSETGEWTNIHTVVLYFAYSAWWRQFTYSCPSIFS